MPDLIKWFRKVEPALPGARELQSRVQELESRLDWLESDHAKLRGRLTGGLRKKAEAEAAQDAPGEANGKQPPSPSQISRLRLQRGF